MNRPDIVIMAKRIAVQAGLDPALVCAICEQESDWDPNAIRYEPGFYNRYIVPLKLTSKTEERARAFSWGLMQVMGQVARENGFAGIYLSELCEPETGIRVGCTVLQDKLKRAGGDLRKGLLFWNGGGRPAYPDEVMGRMEKYR